MKIVIDIPEKYLNSNIIDVTLFMGANKTITYVNVEDEYAEFQVLPKGHGRLIDADKILYFRCPNNVLDCPTSYDFTCQHCDYGVTSKFRIDGMPTSIEADKECDNATDN